MNIHWKDWCWSWSSSTLVTWCEELTHWKRPWCWEGLWEGGEGDDRGWDGSMASPTQWTWVWVDSRSWWWTGKPGVLWLIGSQRVGCDWVTEVNWIEECQHLLGLSSGWGTRHGSSDMQNAQKEIVHPGTHCKWKCLKTVFFFFF